MKQRLFVEFSCDPHNDILLKDLLLVLLLVFVTSSCHNIEVVSGQQTLNFESLTLEFTKSNV